MEREKGVLSAPCPNCGTDRMAAEQADGSVAYACETCNAAAPEATTEKASEADPMTQPQSTPPAPTGSRRGREVGTEVEA